MKLREKTNITLRTKLQNKLKFLLAAKESTLPPTNNIANPHQPINHERITIIGNIQIPETTIELLAKGPRFIPTPKFNEDRLIDDLRTSVATLAYSNRWKNAIESNDNKGGSIKTRSVDARYQLIADCPFKSRRKAPPIADSVTEENLKGLQRDLINIAKRTNLSQINRNIKQKAITNLRNLNNDANITITRSDKGGEIVVMKTEHLIELNDQHLADLNTYEPLAKDPTPTLRNDVNKAIRWTLENKGFPDKVIHRLMNPTNIRTQRFYSLPKTHKPVLKIRPIISASNGIFERLGWLLQYILRPLLGYVKANLGNTQDLISTINSTPKRVLKGKIPISLDVISLYTNIDVDEAINTALEYTLRHKIEKYGLDLGDIHDLLHLLLDNNVFQYNNKIYKQIRGLAMGSRLSGTLAIVCLDRFENTHIYKNLRPKLAFFVRYVDDIGTAVNNIQEAEELLEHLNQKHPTIKFELETPNQDGYLPILDIQLKINENGSISHKHYMKPANKEIMLHCDSHHSETIKRGVVAGAFKRVNTASTPENLNAGITNIKRIMRHNGYHDNWISKTTRRKPNQPQKDQDFILKIPFVSDGFNKQVKTALRRNNISAKIINSRGRSLSAMTTKSMTPPACKKGDCRVEDKCGNSFVVYQGICNICSETYIGSTTRPMHQRAMEHLRSARDKTDASAFGEHYHKTHPNDNINITFKIIRHTSRDELTLRITEGHMIKNYCPRLNRDLGSGYLV